MNSKIQKSISILLLYVSTGFINDFPTDDWPEKKYISFGLNFLISFMIKLGFLSKYFFIFILFITSTFLRFFKLFFF